jgi:hypothetical protein
MVAGGMLPAGVDSSVLVEVPVVSSLLVEVSSVVVAASSVVELAVVVGPGVVGF